MTPARRYRLLGAASLATLLLLSGRLYAVSVLRHAELRDKAERRRRRADVLPACRGQVLDRHGRPLARDLAVDDVAVDLTELDPALELVLPLARALGITRQAARERLEDARALATEDGEPVLVGGAPLEAAERVKRSLRGAGGLTVRFEPGGLAVLADPARLVARARTLEALAPLLEVPGADLQAAVDAEVTSILDEDDRDARVVRWRRPLVVRAEASFEVLARVVERQGDLPGVRVVRRYRRVYPRGEVAAHLVGTIGAPSPEERANDRARGVLVDEGGGALGLLMGERDDLPEGARLRDQPRGRTGAERAFEGALAGRPGVRVVVRDARGRPRATLRDLPPEDGRDLRLTIDADLQAPLEAALDEAVLRHGDAEAGGAAVVIDLRQGDVLALASSPRYDPNTMGARFAEWRDDPRRPLFDRSVAAFPPASTWKVLTAFAMTDDAQEGAVPLGWTTECHGKLFPGKPGPFRCDGYHGPTDLGRALERSCNVFFFRAADRVGLDAMAAWAERLGLGRRLLGLPGERAGLVPTSGMKEARFERAAAGLHARWREALEVQARGGDPAAVDLAQRRLERAAWWVGACADDRKARPGDARNASIGQGDVMTTPVQVALLAGLVATGGRAPLPRVDADRPVVWHEADLPAGALARVREGMRRVVTRGTASDARLGLRGLDVAGKTGTAERAKGQAKLAWFMGYYPAARPEVAFAVLVDRTEGHGGEVCAPVTRALIDAYEATKRPRGRP
ncbi:MAG: penicillin-binding transpeptidase domain-containing protein [Planctomycetes bacterium]|nr:penicillin-binding transpeptidase domain-containing protein [Planctomycetota bacterium]